ncbi:septum formation initiator family protein [Plantactinospora sp. B24E8]|uniref:FtsB family cell division protein n=1 Tax=Plantactinospora sp. B24E8 TaxID=3153567 RepID=UPI00325DCA42
MTQRRTPSGQGPARRPGRPGRPVSRESGGRAEPRSGATRSTGSTRSSTGRAAGAARSTEGARSGNRPGAARRTGVSRVVKRTSATHPRRYTGRAGVLIGVLVALALAYTYPVRVYLDQQSDIARMEADLRAQRELIGDLEVEAALWDDPEYVKIQARERFYMVLPGETPLVVLRNRDDAAREAARVDPKAAEQTAAEPWYDTLWSSVRAANEAEQAGQ